MELTWDGMRTVDGLTWINARSASPVVNGKLRIRNTLMFDRFNDQVSIVRWTNRRGVRTVVLSARVPDVFLE
jgi:hypothetical protein